MPRSYYQRVLAHSSSATMKTLVVLSAVVAIVNARPGYLAGGIVNYNTLLNHYRSHVVLTPEGVPVDTPAVQAARAAHLAAHDRARTENVSNPAQAATASHPAGIGNPAEILALDAPVGGFAYSTTSIHPAPRVLGFYHGPAASIILTPEGVPVDTPEVQAARLVDAIAHQNAKTRHLYG